MSNSNYNTNQKRFTTKNIAFIGMFAAIMAICSWITVPTVVPFTLQTFGVFLAVSLLGGRDGFLSVLVFVLLGAVGAPVFAGFSGGLGVLLGSTGGYIIGFIFSALVMWLFEKELGHKFWVLAVSAIIGLIICYAFGTFWFMQVYAKANGPVGVITALGWCVIPFVIPDLIKLAAALVLGARLRKVIINL